MEHDPDRSPLCPSAQPAMEGSVVFGVVGGTSDEPRVGYLTEPQETGPAVLRLAETVKPTESSASPPAVRAPPASTSTVPSAGWRGRSSTSCRRSPGDCLPLSHPTPLSVVAAGGAQRLRTLPPWSSPRTIDPARRYAARQRLEAPDGPHPLGSF